MTYTILFLKLFSYRHVNLWCRERRASAKAKAGEAACQGWAGLGNSGASPCASLSFLPLPPPSFYREEGQWWGSPTPGHRELPGQPDLWR